MILQVLLRGNDQFWRNFSKKLNKPQTLNKSRRRSFLNEICAFFSVFCHSQPVCISSFPFTAFVCRLSCLARLQHIQPTTHPPTHTHTSVVAIDLIMLHVEKYLNFCKRRRELPGRSGQSIDSERLDRLLNQFSITAFESAPSLAKRSHSQNSQDSSLVASRWCPKISPFFHPFLMLSVLIKRSLRLWCCPLYLYTTLPDSKTRLQRHTMHTWRTKRFSAVHQLFTQDSMTNWIDLPISYPNCDLILSTWYKRLMNQIAYCFPFVHNWEDPWLLLLFQLSKF